MRKRRGLRSLHVNRYYDMIEYRDTLLLHEKHCVYTVRTQQSRVHVNPNATFAEQTTRVGSYAVCVQRLNAIICSVSGPAKKPRPIDICNRVRACCCCWNTIFKCSGPFHCTRVQLAFPLFVRKGRTASFHVTAAFS